MRRVTHSPPAGPAPARHIPAECTCGSRGSDSYPDYPSESWPIIYYRITLNRHDYFYRNFILVPWYADGAQTHPRR